MSADSWQQFLTQWSKDVLTSSELAQGLPAEVRASGWLGYPGATEAQIAQVEARLKTTLPPSYRKFLKVTNGWWMTTGTYQSKLWSTEEIEWLAVRRPDLIEGWMVGREIGNQIHGESEPIPNEVYFVYGEEQDSYWFRDEYLHTALEISDYCDGIYLLNPQTTTPEGEWEAWRFAPWLGAVRYRSFWKMMQDEHQEFLRLESYEKKRVLPGDDLQVLMEKLPGLIGELQHRIKYLRSLRSEQPGTLQYHLGLVDGLQFAETRIHEIQAQTQDPQELYKQLSALASELKTRSQRMKVAKIGPDLVRILLGGRGGIDRYVRSNARLMGYREAKNIICWFLAQK